MDAEAKAVVSVGIQKLTYMLNEESIVNNKVTMHQLKLVHTSLKKLQRFSEETDVFGTFRMSDCLCVLYEVEDEIEKFVFRVARARQRKRFGFLKRQTPFLHKLNSCRTLIRKINKITSNISSFPTHLAATPSKTITSSSTVYPISSISPTPSLKLKSLTRSLSTIPQLHEQLPKNRKLTSSYSFNSDAMLTHPHDQCSDKVMVKGYDDLSHHLKLCLLYLAQVRKGKEISVRRLIRLWLAEGFVERRSQQPFCEGLAHKYFEDLVAQGMIQITKYSPDNSPKKCCLLSVLHDYLSPKSQDIGLFHIHRILEHFEEAAGPFGVRRMVHRASTRQGLVTTAWERKFDPSLLRSYVSFNRQHKDTSAKEVGIILTRIIKSDFCLLRVLDLEGVNNPTLPHKLGQLRNLRYLGLRGTYLDRLPESVGELVCLETLDVKRTCVKILPNSIWKLKKLRYLNLNKIRLPMPPGSSLNLLTLWGLVLDEKITVNEGLTKMLDLEELSVEFHLTTSQGVLLDWIAKLVNLKSMRLTSVDDMGRPSNLVLKPLTALDKLSNLNLCGILERLPTLNEFPPTVKVLTLSISQLNKDPMETLERLPCLIVLRLLGDSFLGKKLVCHQGGFKKLEVLKLWILTGLEEWKVEEEAMESLKQLDIRRCNNLKNISSRLLLKPKCLEEILLTDMPDDFAARTTNRKHTDTSLKINYSVEYSSLGCKLFLLRVKNNAVVIVHLISFIKLQYFYDSENMNTFLEVEVT